MSKCQRHSARWHKYRRAKVKRRARWESKVSDLEHKISRVVVEEAVRQGVKVIALGDVRNIGDGKRLSAKSQQKISQWSHGRMRSTSRTSGTLWYRGGVGERSLYQSNLPEMWAQTQTQGAGLSLCKRSLRVCRASGCGGSLQHLVKTRPQPSRGYVPSVCSCPSPLRLSKNKTNQHKSIWRLCQ